MTNSQSSFQRCKSELSVCERCQALLEPGAFPLFQKSPTLPCRVLFVLEAPNRDDTYNPSKGYLTIEADTDPSGRFFLDLFRNDAGLDIKELYVTNSVLCLPKRKHDRHPVSGKMMRLCTENISRMIDVFQPQIVCPVGTVALRATRLIDDHGRERLKDAVAREIPWNSRILFPLYHTGMLARNGPSGRNETQQREDWRALARLLN